jgi:hypothetical protein
MIKKAVRSSWKAGGSLRTWKSITKLQFLIERNLHNFTTGLGSKIRDPEKPIPDPNPEVEKAPDPGYGTLDRSTVNIKIKFFLINIFQLLILKRSWHDSGSQIHIPPNAKIKIRPYCTKMLKLGSWVRYKATRKQLDTHGWDPKKSCSIK